MKDICNEHMRFQECELAIVRAAVDKAEEVQGRRVVRLPEVKKIINVTNGHAALLINPVNKTLIYSSIIYFQR